MAQLKASTMLNSLLQEEQNLLLSTASMPLSKSTISQKLFNLRIRKAEPFEACALWVLMLKGEAMKRPIITSKWRIELRKLGRGKVSKDVEVLADSLEGAEIEGIKSCYPYLASRCIDLDDHGDLTYGILAGFRTVGAMRIVSI